MKTKSIAFTAVGALALGALAFQLAPLGAAEMGGMQMHPHMAQMQPMQGGGHMQTPGMGQMQQQMPGMKQASGDQGPSSLAFKGANDKMHEAMAITYTGNADVDFVRGMIPHHRGAIDMAKIVKAFGTDPEIKALADAVIKAQEAEIAQMEAWLKKNAK